MTDGSQEFCLRWNNHQATIISVFDYLLENETLVDCTLAAEGQYLKAHKVVLCACSPYLELLLSQHNDKHPILIFKDIKFSELKSMLDYMYKGEVNIAQDQINHFLKAAESLQIKGLSESEDETTPQSAPTPTPRPPPPRAPPIQRTQPRPSFSNAVAVRNTGPPEVVDLPESPKRINRADAASPTPRKRRRQLPPSQGRPSLSGDDASNASEGHFDQSNACDVPIPASTTSTPKPSVDQDGHSNVVAKVETNTELILEPKTEYDDVNDNSVEDLTLDDDEDFSQPGPSQMDNSQGNMMNFGGWQQMVGDRTGDDVFAAGQDSVGGAQNSQDSKKKKHNCANCHANMNNDIMSFIRHVSCCMNTKNNYIKKCVVCTLFKGSFDHVISHIMSEHYPFVNVDNDIDDNSRKNKQNGSKIKRKSKKLNETIEKNDANQTVEEVINDIQIIEINENSKNKSKKHRNTQGSNEELSKKRKNNKTKHNIKNHEDDLLINEQILKNLKEVSIFLKAEKIENEEVEDFLLEKAIKKKKKKEKTALEKTIENIAKANDKKRLKKDKKKLEKMSKSKDEEIENSSNEIDEEVENSSNKIDEHVKDSEDILENVDETKCVENIKVVSKANKKYFHYDDDVDNDDGFVIKSNIPNLENSSSTDMKTSSGTALIDDNIFTDDYDSKFVDNKENKFNEIEKNNSNQSPNNGTHQMNYETNEQHNLKQINVQNVQITVKNTKENHFVNQSSIPSLMDLKPIVLSTKEETNISEEEKKKKKENVSIQSAKIDKGEEKISKEKSKSQSIPHKKNDRNKNSDFNHFNQPFDLRQRVDSSKYTSANNVPFSSVGMIDNHSFHRENDNSYNLHQSIGNVSIDGLHRKNDHDIAINYSLTKKVDHFKPVIKKPLNRNDNFSGNNNLKPKIEHKHKRVIKNAENRKKAIEDFNNMRKGIKNQHNSRRANENHIINRKTNDKQHNSRTANEKHHINRKTNDNQHNSRKANENHNINRKTNESQLINRKTIGNHQNNRKPIFGPQNNSSNLNNRQINYSPNPHRNKNIDYFQPNQFDPRNKFNTNSENIFHSTPVNKTFNKFNNLNKQQIIPFQKNNYNNQWSTNKQCSPIVVPYNDNVPRFYRNFDISPHNFKVVRMNEVMNFKKRK